MLVQVVQYILEINNCTGRYNLANWTNDCTVIIKNCRDFVITNVSNGVTIKIESSEVNMESHNKKINLHLKDSSIGGANNTIYNFEIFTSYNGIISICMHKREKVSDIGTQ